MTITSRVSIGAALLMLAASPTARAQVPTDRVANSARRDSLESAFGRLLLAAPFRASRRPPETRFALEPEAAPGPVEDPFAVLRVVGVLTGNAPVAIIDGVPGQSAPRVFAPGDTMGGVKLERVIPKGAYVRAAGARRLLTLVTP